MINLFYYCSMGLVALMVVLVMHAILGPMFWVIVVLVVVASAYEGNKLAKKQLREQARQRDD